MRKPGFGKVSFILAVFFVATAVASHAQTYTKLVNFTQTNGAGPAGPLVQGINGNLYGVTNIGGVSSHCPGLYGCGTVFEVTPDGNVTTLYNFCQQAKCADGALPLPGLVLATNGNFYGMTGDSPANGGTIFEITPSGKLTTLYSFCSKSASCPDGEGPEGTLMQAENGNLYGVAVGGGDYTQCHGGGCGVIFEITLAGAYSTFHVFCSTTPCTRDGRFPRTGLIQSTNGNYIGTTSGGGPGESGIIYEITPAGKLAILYDLCSQPHCTDASGPSAPPIQAANENLYGTAGGGTNGAGVIYELTLAKNFTDLYDFCSQRTNGICTDGAGPLGLVQGTDGNFYGVAPSGGTSSLCGAGVGCGAIFEFTSGGKFNDLYDFCSQTNCTDGGAPTGLMQATNGMFYGTDGIGGTGSGCSQGLGCGAIYSLSMGLGPFVESTSNFGKIGQVVTVLGNNLTGTTSVTFNGTAAKFTVGSGGTYLKATVPTGATTGTIEVTTPSATLSSNMAFQVLP